jgi:predicted AlkP superfamily pyrophosphatase or phosphodiesterase
MPLGRGLAAACMTSLLVTALGAVQQIGPARPLPDVRRAVIVSIDGLRPDLISMDLTPTMYDLMRRGSYTQSARTIPEGYTLPSHASMLTGVSAERHGVTWNQHIEDAYPEVPTLFELARRAGLTTAMVAGKTKMIVFTRPGDLNWTYLGYEGLDSDMAIARRAARVVAANNPHVLLVHLAEVDLTGHRYGWASTEQRAAIKTADRAVSLVLQALGRRRNSTLVVLTADHGGHGFQHDPENELSQLIPWIAVGPGIRRNFDLAAAGTAVDTKATFGIVCAALGVAVEGGIDAVPLRAIVERPFR